jgi:hypothetical protein
VGHARASLPAALVRRRQEACFIVRDVNGQALAYVYFEEEPGRRAKALYGPFQGPYFPAAQLAINVIGLSSGWHIRGRRRA